MLSDAQIDQIAAFLRALNALENIRSSNAYDASARSTRRSWPPAASCWSRLAIGRDAADAIEVL